MDTRKKVTILIIAILFMVNLSSLMILFFTNRSIPHMIVNSTFVILFYNMFLDWIRNE